MTTTQPLSEKVARGRWESDGFVSDVFLSCADHDFGPIAAFIIAFAEFYEDLHVFAARDVCPQSPAIR